MTPSPPGSRTAPGARPGPDFRALLFDLDGVLLDSEPLHKEAKREAFARLGREAPAIKIRLLENLGLGITGMLRQANRELAALP